MDMLFFLLYIAINLCARSYEVYHELDFYVFFFHVSLTPLHVRLHRPFTLS